jgi:hypothetical protein
MGKKCKSYGERLREIAIAQQQEENPSFATTVMSSIKGLFVTTSDKT